MVVLALAAAMVLCVLPSYATTWDAVAEFSSTANPNGVWLYGQAGPLFPNHGDYMYDPNLQGWWGNPTEAVPSPSAIVKNVTGAAYDFDDGVGIITIPADMLFVVAEGANPYWMVQWTAPTAGTYVFTATGKNINYVALDTTTVNIYCPFGPGALGSPALAKGEVWNWTSGPVTMTAGQWFQWYSPQGKAVGLQATVTAVPEPSTLAGFATMLSGIGLAALRRRTR